MKAKQTNENVLLMDAQHCWKASRLDSKRVEQHWWATLELIHYGQFVRRGGTRLIASVRLFPAQLCPTIYTLLFLPLFIDLFQIRTKYSGKKKKKAWTCCDLNLLLTFTATLSNVGNAIMDYGMHPLITSATRTEFWMMIMIMTTSVNNLKGEICSHSTSGCSSIFTTSFAILFTGTLLKL